MKRSLFKGSVAAGLFVGFTTVSYGVTILSENFDPLSGGAGLQVGYTVGDTVFSSWVSERVSVSRAILGKRLTPPHHGDGFSVVVPNIRMAE